jgi:glutathione S-transferase
MSAYTLVIGNKNYSSWSLRPWLALKMAGVPFEEVQVLLYQPNSRALLTSHSATGKVPVLKIADAGKITTVWDSLAICETIAERHPEAQLWPSDPDARAVARSYAAEMHSSFPDVRQHLAMNFASTVPTPTLDEATNKQVARIINAWETALAGREDGFLFGRFSIADCMYAPVASRFLTYGIDLPAASAAYVARLMALPALKEWRAAAEAELAKGWTLAV